MSMNASSKEWYNYVMWRERITQQTSLQKLYRALAGKHMLVDLDCGCDWWGWRAKTIEGDNAESAVKTVKGGRYYCMGRMKDWKLGGRVQEEVDCLVLVEGECREWSTMEDATCDLHSLGFPVIGLTNVTMIKVMVTVTMAVFNDELESYKEAMRGSDMDISDSD